LKELDNVINARVLQNIVEKEKFIDWVENWESEEFGRRKKSVYNIL
jgi:hypothetical protein